MGKKIHEVALKMVKGWKKITKDEWHSKNTGRIIIITPYYQNRSDKATIYMVNISGVRGYHSTPDSESVTFLYKESAIKFAEKWMKKHPRG